MALGDERFAEADVRDADYGPDDEGCNYQIRLDKLGWEGTVPPEVVMRAE